MRITSLGCARSRLKATCETTDSSRRPWPVPRLGAGARAAARAPTVGQHHCDPRPPRQTAPASVAPRSPSGAYCGTLRHAQTLLSDHANHLQLEGRIECSSCSLLCHAHLSSSGENPIEVSSRLNHDTFPRGTSACGAGPFFDYLYRLHMASHIRTYSYLRNKRQDEVGESGGHFNAMQLEASATRGRRKVSEFLAAFAGCRLEH